MKNGEELCDINRTLLRIIHRFFWRITCMRNFFSLCQRKNFLKRKKEQEPLQHYGERIGIYSVLRFNRNSFALVVQPNEALSSKVECPFGKVHHVGRLFFLRAEYNGYRQIGNGKCRRRRISKAKKVPVHVATRCRLRPIPILLVVIAHQCFLQPPKKKKKTE